MSAACRHAAGTPLLPPSHVHHCLRRQALLRACPAARHMGAQRCRAVVLHRGAVQWCSSQRGWCLCAYRRYCDNTAWAWDGCGTVLLMYACMHACMPVVRAHGTAAAAALSGPCYAQHLLVKISISLISSPRSSTVMFGNYLQAGLGSKPLRCRSLHA